MTFFSFTFITQNIFFIEKKSKKSAYFPDVDNFTFGQG